MNRLEREIAEAVTSGSAAGARRLLRDHTGEATAYLVGDYPYGFRERTKIRYWVERKPRKGWRFVSQTMNPKTAAWNKPKASTYADWGGAMYLDEDGHVQWEGIGRYSSPEKILALVREFPGVETDLAKVVPVKIRLARGLLSGEIFVTVNGVRQPRTEADDERTKRELDLWEEIGALVSREP